VSGTPFDFREPSGIGARYDAADPQLAIAGAFDHNFVLDRKTKDGLEPAARLCDPASGRVVEVSTTLPGLQFFSNGMLKEGLGPPAPRRGVALEAQHFPDAPNQPAFPSAILRPGEVYAERIAYRFSLE